MDTDEDMDVTVIEARLSGTNEDLSSYSLVGYGRTREEAKCQVGLEGSPDAIEQFTEIPVRNGDCPLSGFIANRICTYHLRKDHSTPTEVKDKLKALLSAKKYGSAVNYCFKMIWDGGFQGY